MAKKKKTSKPKMRSLSPEEQKIIKTFRETGDVPSSYITSSDINIQQLRSASREIKNKYKQALEQLQLSEQRLETLLAVKKFKSSTSYSTAKSKKDGEAVAVAVASDWHIEERIDPATVNGLNSYDLNIGAERSERFFKNLLKLVQIQRSGINIDTLVLAILGDIITGYIHEELMEENQLSPTEALLYSKSLLCNGIDFLLKHGDFKKLIIVFSIGNHGRTTKKKRIATAAKNSFEWLMYNVIVNEYSKNKKIEFVLGTSYHSWVTLFNNYKIRFHHGDSIRYWGGVGGITIPVNKAIAQWNKTQTADLDVFGHFHQFFDGGNFICNGSMIGYNPFAISIKAPFEPPKQAFFLVDRKRGKTIVAPIFVTPK